MSQFDMSGNTINTACALIRDGREAEASDILSPILTEHTGTQCGAADVGRFLWQNGFQDEALAMFRHAGETDTDDMDALFSLVSGLYQAEQWSTLMPFGESLCERDPKNSRNYQLFAWACFAAEEYDKCRDVIATALDKGDYGVNFQPGSPYIIADAIAARIAEARRSAAQGRIDANAGLYGGPAAVTWAVDRIGAGGARLNGATVDIDSAAFEIAPADRADAPPTRVEAVGEGGEGSITRWRADVDGLSPGTAYEVRLTAEEASGDPVAFTTGKETAADVGGLDAVWCGDSGAVLAGTVGGTTLPTRYHFSYGGSPETLDQRTPEKWVPPGRRLRVRQEAVDAAIEWKLCTVERDVVGESPDPESPDAFAIRLIGPFCKDRNHTAGIGVGDLFLGWFARWFTHGETDDTGRGHASDLRDAEVELTLRPRGLDARDFVLAAVAQSATGGQSTEKMKDTATWCLTADTADTSTFDETAWNRVCFTFPSNPRAWTYCGNNPVEQEHAARYAYLPIDDVLATHKGNVAFWFTLGDWRQPPEGDMDLRAMALRWRDWSVLAPAMGARLTEFPRDSLTDPLNLTCGRFDDADAMWFSAPGPDGPQAFEWSFDADVVPTVVKFHQNPLKPASAIAFATIDADGSVAQEWRGELLRPTLIADPPRPFVINFEGSPPIRRIRFVIEAGYDEDFWGFDAIEVFAEDVPLVPELDPASLSEEITGLEPGQTLYYRLVAENAAGTTESSVHEIGIPATRAPVIVSGHLAKQTEDRARLFLDIRPGGLETTLTGTVTGPGGDTWKGRKQNAGENAAVRHALFLVDCPKSEGPYRAEITAANQAGESEPLVLEWEVPALA